MKMLLVLNKDDQTVMFLDQEEGEIVASLRVDRNPHEAILTPDDKVAYVSNAGGRTVSVIDVEMRHEVTRIENDEWRFPHGLEVTRDGLYLMVAATYSNAIWVYRRDPEDPASHELVKVIETGQEKSHMVHFSPDGRRAYVPNIGSGTVSVVDVAEMEVSGRIAVGPGPEGVAVHPLDGTIYVANQGDGTLMVIDPDSLEVVHTLQLGDTPVRATFSHDGEYCFVANRLSHDISVIAHEWSGATAEPQPWEIKRLPVGRWPGQIVMGPGGNHAWVTNNKTNDISEIDLGTLTETRRFTAGIHPDGMIWVP
ncbi:MAG: beta-propeller fold lactonase family protein [Chloroflexota bacterium]